MGWCGLWGDSPMKRRNEEWHLKWEKIENNHSACLMCCFWSVREGVLLMVNLASYYGLNLSLLIVRGGQLIKLNDPDIISQLKGTVIQFDIDLCEAHIVNRRPRLNRVFWSRWYSQRKIYRCWRPCTHLSLQAFNRKRKYFQDKILDLRKHTLKEKRKSNQIVQSFIIRVPVTMECGTKRISSDASCVVCVLCIPYFAPSAEHLQCVTIVKIKSSLLCCITTENTFFRRIHIKLEKKCKIRKIKPTHMCQLQPTHVF